METTNQSGGILTGVLTALMILFLGGGIYYWNESKKMTHQNDLTEQRADSLMSVKLQLEGDIRNLDTKLETVNDEKAYLDKKLTDVDNQLAQRERTLVVLRRSAGNQSKTIKALNQSMASLTLVRDSLQNQIVAVTDKADQLNNANQELTGRNKALDAEITNLNAVLLTKVPRSAVTGDAFRVETIKGNKKETAKARKVNELMVSLNVPAELGLTGTQEVYLSLTDEQHNTVLTPLRTMTINLNSANEVVPVHAEQSVDFGRNPQRVSFTIAPDKTMKPGLYRASVYTKDAYLGTTEFQLRDSFWFF